MLWQLYIAVAVEKKLFEVATMIQKDTQLFNGKKVPAGPALREADGTEHVKSATEGKGGAFPFKVATEGVMVRVQDAEATRDEDQVSILNHIVRSDDPLGQPPREHEEYDKLNRMVRGLFIGAALYTHAMSGNTEKLRELLSEGAEKIDYQAPDGATPASIAAFGGHSDCLRILVQSKANLDVPDKTNTTPTLMAAYKGDSDCLRILAQSKANLDIPMKNNVTPAYKAAEKGNSDCLLILAENKANLDLPTNKDNRTPTFISAEKGNSDCLLILAQSKANLDLPNKDNVTPTFIAAQFGQVDCLLILAQSKANLDLPNKDNVTPTFMAAVFGHSDCIQILVDHKADVNQAWKGCSPLSKAKAKGHSATVEILLAAGAE